MAMRLASESGPLTGRLEEICESFESAWRRSERWTIEEILPTAGTLRDKALVDLVHIELELRLEEGEAARAEEYFARFPDLADDPVESLALVKAEFKHRLSCEPDFSPSEYVERFPWLSQELESLIKMPPRRDTLQSA